ncbi:MAG: aldo/keto reductase, partial [Desulfurococcales archaeon]|nr:aldo/keto reductase [Desulfurococcales archaeon]
DNVDTAEIYDGGRAEEFVGKIAREVGRENIFVTTKMHPSHLVDRYEVIRAGKAALRRLNMDYVDLFLIHWPNANIPISKQVRNFEALVEEGITRYMGVSNFGIRELAEAIHSTKKFRVVADQVHYSVYDRWPERTGLLQFAMENNVVIQAYTPLERGTIASGTDILDEIARLVGHSRVQVALNYLISTGNVIPIPKTEKIEHVEEIAGSMGWCLDEELLVRIRKNLAG